MSERSLPAGTIAAVGLGLGLGAWAAALAPVAVYVSSLAIFGLSHLAYEFRYCDKRFGLRYGRRFLLGVAVIGLSIAAIRALRVAGVAAFGSAGTIEGALLIAACAWPLVLGGKARAVAAVFSLLFVLGWIADAMAAMIVFASIHNLTPIAFLGERFTGKRRAVAVATAAAAALVPAWLVYELAPLQASGTAFAAWFGAPGRHLGSFVPHALIGAPDAWRLFAAAAYLQVFHYAMTIVVLPALGRVDDAEGGLLRWPSPRRFGGAVLLGSAGALGAFLLSFDDARSLYGIVAAVHAFIEPPLLLGTPALDRPRFGAAIGRFGIT